MPQKRIFFVHGKVVDGWFCPWCDARRSGRIIRETYRFSVVMSCGHVRRKVAYTLPPEELERKGYVNQKGTEDPRFTAHKAALFAGAMQRFEERKRERWAQENLGGGRAVM